MNKLNKINAGKILIIFFLLFVAVTTNGTNYYVKDEAHGGNDASNGLSPFTAWRTLEKVNAEMGNFNPGDAILFERGSWFYGTIEIRCSGTYENPIVFGAYGTGNKPVFIFAKQENLLSDWSLVAGRTNIWENRDLTFYVDVANLIFSPGPTFGKKLMNANSTSLSAQGDFWYDFDNNRILIYSVGNPASVYSNIQCVLSHNAIEFPDNDQYIVFENLAFKWYGRCIVETKGSNCSYKNLDISFIGGADHSYQPDEPGGGPDAYKNRYGNGLQMWQNVHDVTITGCKIDNVYDAGISPQGDENTPGDVYNLLIRNNVITKCEYNFEFWNQSPSINIHDIYFENNTCAYAGGGWGHDQRPLKLGSNFMIEHLPVNNSNIFIRNNIFYGATEQLFLIVYPKEVGNIISDYNNFYKTGSEPVGAFGWKNRIPYDSLTEWQAEINKESNSIYCDPLFVSSTDFHLQPGSPLIGKGTNGYMGAFCPFYIGDKILTTQSEVNAFNYPGITGILTISGEDIADLSPLSGLKYAGGGLKIENNPLLTNLNGFQNLITVGKTEWVYEAPEGFCMEITGNAALINLSGLINLKTIEGGLIINSNGALTNLNGLQNLSYLGCSSEPDGSRHGAMCRSLKISGNPSLTNIDGFQKITSCEGYISIDNNSSLTNLNGLQNLTGVGEFLSISDNSSLIDIDSLSNLTTVGGHVFLGDGPGGYAPIIERRGLIISGNTSLTNLDGLQNLISVGGDIVISGNSKLLTIKKLNKLTTVHGGVGIINNGELSSLDGLQGLISLQNHLDISGNVSITSLVGLENLTSVGNELLGPDNQNLSGSLMIRYNNSLLNLDGLKNLITIGEDFSITGNDSLNNLDGIENLTSVGEGNVFKTGDIEILNNPELDRFCGLYKLLCSDEGKLAGELNIDGNKVDPTMDVICNDGPCITIYNGDLTLSSQAEVDAFYFTEITGNLTIGGDYNISSDITNLTQLSSLISVGGNLDIFKNDFLTNLGGLENLTYLGGFFSSMNMFALKNVDGLRNLTSINGNLILAGNPSLSNIDGFENITSVGGYLQIAANGLLTNIKGLQNLISVGSWFDIVNNASLTNLSGLEKLTTVVGNLDIHSNEALTSFCDLYPLIKGDGLGGVYTVYDNAANPTKEEIIAGGPCVYNNLPVVNAGPDQVVDEGTLVTLDGSSSSDPDNDELFYKWTAPEGITLSSETVANPTFTAPEVTSDTNYTFYLVVNDGLGDSPTDSVMITVKDIITCPQHFHTVWEGTYGIDHMIFNVFNAKLDNTDLESGDEIGVFDSDLCVGYGKVTGIIDNQNVLTIITSRDDGHENGYTIGNQVTYKFWKCETSTEYPVYDVNCLNINLTPKDCAPFAIGATEFVSLTAISAEKQQVELNTGWNIMSLYVMPEDSNLMNIFHPLIAEEKLIKVMDEAGKVIENWGFFGGWKNLIGNLKSTEGYCVKVTQPATLEVTGMRVKLPFNIPLNLGWNIISWPSPNEPDGKDVFQILIDEGKLIKVMDESGKVIEDWGYFGGWQNRIGNFKPGEGYKVKVSSNCTLTINETGTKSEELIPEQIPSNHFVLSYKGNGIDHMNINLVNLAESGIMQGDEIGIFDGHLCVGSAQISNQFPFAIGTSFVNQNSISIPVSANDGIESKNGYTEGNAINLKIFRNGQEYTVALQPVINKKAIFEKGESLFAIVDLSTSNIGKNNLELTKINCYPNPFSDEVTIEINLAEDSQVQLEVLNQLGQMVRIIKTKQLFNKGLYKIFWNGKDANNQKVTPGVYHLRTNINGVEMHKKIVYSK
jgi:hypothetical protein